MSKEDIKKAKSLTITFLTNVSFASLNGSDKEADNISSIKKISAGTEQYPYVSSQAVRRAMRNQLAVMGWPLSEGEAAKIKKGAATTQCDPAKYIDDDLFGFMNAQKKDAEKGGTNKRTSVVRVSPLIALNPYLGDLDFGTNYMGTKAGGDPNIFETEIHAGLYRGTVLIELDRVGREDGKDFIEDEDKAKAEKAKRVKDFVSAVKNLWTSGRQSRFLADISPKFIAAGLLKVKNPIFLESVIVDNKNINTKILEETVNDYRNELIEYVYGVRNGIFSTFPDSALSIGEGFEKISSWIDSYYLP